MFVWILVLGIIILLFWTWKHYFLIPPRKPIQYTRIKPTFYQPTVSPRIVREPNDVPDRNTFEIITPPPSPFKIQEQLLVKRVATLLSPPKSSPMVIIDTIVPKVQPVVEHVEKQKRKREEEIMTKQKEIKTSGTKRMMPGSAFKESDRKKIKYHVKATQRPVHLCIVDYLKHVTKKVQRQKVNLSFSSPIMKKKSKIPEIKSIVTVPTQVPQQVPNKTVESKNVLKKMTPTGTNPTKVTLEHKMDKVETTQELTFEIPKESPKESTDTISFGSAFGSSDPPVTFGSSLFETPTTTDLPSSKAPTKPVARRKVLK
jgi:hypothetical protein